MIVNLQFFGSRGRGSGGGGGGGSSGPSPSQNTGGPSRTYTVYGVTSDNKIEIIMIKAQSRGEAESIVQEKSNLSEVKAFVTDKEENAEDNYAEKLDQKYGEYETKSEDQYRHKYGKRWEDANGY